MKQISLVLCASVALVALAFAIELASGSYDTFYNNNGEHNNIGTTATKDGSTVTFTSNDGATATYTYVPSQDLYVNGLMAIHFSALSPPGDYSWALWDGETWAAAGWLERRPG